MLLALAQSLQQPANWYNFHSRRRKVASKMLPILLLLCPTSYLSNLPSIEATYLSSTLLPSSPSSISNPSSPLLCSSEGLCCPHRSSKCVVKQDLSIYPNPWNPHPSPIKLSKYFFTMGILQFEAQKGQKQCWGQNWQGFQVQVVHADHSLDPRTPCYCDPTCVFFADCCQDFHQFCQAGRARSKRRRRRRRKKYRRWIPM